MQAIQLKLRAFITDSFLFGREDTPLAGSDSLVETGVIDSTGVLMLVGFLEKEFGIRVQDDEIVPENLDSIDRILAYVSNKLAAHAAQDATSPIAPASDAAVMASAI